MKKSMAPGYRLIISMGLQAWYFFPYPHMGPIVHKLIHIPGKLSVVCQPKKEERFAQFMLEQERASSDWEKVTCGFCKREKQTLEGWDEESRNEKTHGKEKQKNR